MRSDALEICGNQIGRDGLGVIGMDAQRREDRGGGGDQTRRFDLDGRTRGRGPQRASSSLSYHEGRCG